MTVRRKRVKGFFVLFFIFLGAKLLTGAYWDKDETMTVSDTVDIRLLFTVAVIGT